MEKKCDCVMHRQWMFYWAGHLIVTSTWASFNLLPLIVAMVLEKYAWCTTRLLEQGQF